MNLNYLHPQSMAESTLTEGSAKKVRKPYTITKSRESWTDEEHDKFIEALQLFDRDWKKIEDYVGSKTVIQIRSHAQKYFLKVQKNGTIAHVPPPRPKRKAAHPYPQKAARNDLVPQQLPMSYPSALDCISPGYSPWDDASILLNTASSGIALSENEYISLHGVEADIKLEGVAKTGIRNFTSSIANSSTTLPSCDMTKKGKQDSLNHGIPDFAEVYSFIGSVFDPDTKGHAQKLKEMDPISFETVLLLMRNLAINLASPDFEPIKEVLSSYDVNSNTGGCAAGAVARNQNN